MATMLIEPLQRRGSISKSEATERPAGLNQLEYAVIRLAILDGRAERAKSSLFAALAQLGGARRRNRLADPKLEVLRCYAKDYSVRHVGAWTAAIEQLCDAGYSSGQIDLVNLGCWSANDLPSASMMNLEIAEHARVIDTSLVDQMNDARAVLPIFTAEDRGT